MRRISTATRVVNKFGASKDGFTNGDAVGGVPATDLEDVWFDHVQEEIANVVEGAGLTLDTSNRAQLLAAIQRMFAPAIGGARNVAMSVTAASASATLTADEITVGTALGGKKFLLSGFNKTINLATTGAGGMDTGAAPVSGFVALYAIYNPATGASALLATNATSAVQPNVYGGANMPAGYTASALVSVAPTNASSQFPILTQVDRVIAIAQATLFSSNTINSTPVSFTSTAFPKNARSISGGFTVASTGASSMSLTLQSALGVGSQTNNAGTGTGGSQQTMPFNKLAIATPQTLFWASASSVGTPTFTAAISSYEI